MLIQLPAFTDSEDSEHEFPEKKLDLYKLESKPVVLFQAANLCSLAPSNGLTMLWKALEVRDDSSDRVGFLR